MIKQPKADGSFIELTPALQQWVDMADKERFGALLERDMLKEVLRKILKLCEKEQKTFLSISDGLRTYSQPSESSKFAKKITRIIEKSEVQIGR